MALAKVTTLYKEDFCLWIEETINLLKAGDFSQIDIDNLIEEIASLGKRDKRELKNRLITLFEHILKRKYVPSSDCYRGWEVTIKRTQSQIKDILADSPSLRNLLIEIYHDCYDEAVENMQIEYDVDFPEIYPFTDEMEELLNSQFC